MYCSIDRNLCSTGPAPKDEVQQDGKNANMPPPGIEPGTPADVAGALPTELPGPGPKPNQNERHCCFGLPICLLACQLISHSLDKTHRIK